jgi:hypothetical protein
MLTQYFLRLVNRNLSTLRLGRQGIGLRGVAPFLSFSLALHPLLILLVILALGSSISS